MKLIEELEAYKRKVDDYCNNTADFRKASQHSYITDKIDALITAMGDFEAHNTEYCPLYNDIILPNEAGDCSLCGGAILELK